DRGIQTAGRAGRRGPGMLDTRFVWRSGRHGNLRCAGGIPAQHLRRRHAHLGGAQPHTYRNELRQGRRQSRPGSRATAHRARAQADGRATPGGAARLRRPPLNPIRKPGHGPIGISGLRRSPVVRNAPYGDIDNGLLRRCNSQYQETYMDLKLSGQRVLITGASQGIGAGLAHAFAAEGCHLALVARSADKLQALADGLRSDHGVQVSVLPLDMTLPGAIERVAEFAGDVDVLVNNAGAIPGGDLWEVDAQAWRKGWELKVFGYIDLVRAIYPRMKARGNGVILNNIGNGGQNPDFNYI